MAEALDGVGIIPLVQLQKALMQIKGALIAIVNITVTSAPSLIVFPTGVSIMRALCVEEAVAMIPAGASIMVGGFMGVGTPERLLDEAVRQQKSRLSLISNDAAVPGKGVGKLFDAALVSRLTATHIGLNPKAQQQMLANQIAVDLIPQGTFVERIRAGGCGLGGVLTPTGVGTLVAEGKRQIEVNGTTFLLETALRAQFALVHAFLADYLGNLTYALTARNFNPIMAMAADTVMGLKLRAVSA